MSGDPFDADVPWHVMASRQKEAEEAAAYAEDQALYYMESVEAEEARELYRSNLRAREIPEVHYHEGPDPRCFGP